MARKYIISPIEHLLSLDKPSLHMLPIAGDWPSKNLTINQKRMEKRWGYSEDRDLEENVQGVYLYQENDGTRHTLYLTDTNLCLREASGTWSYKTEEYSTGDVTDISTVTVTGNGTTWVTAMVGDYFVLDEDLPSPESEPDNSWRKITAASTTSLTLSPAAQRSIHYIG